MLRRHLILSSAVLCALGSAGHVTLAEPAAAVPATRPAAAQADLPVSRVVLYSSGVGYFEHFGTVRGNGSAELRFKADQINDVLKSLVLQDLDKGQVSGVTYPSNEPLDRQLKAFRVDVTGNPPMADLLNQLRGTTVDVTLTAGKAEPIRGVVVGVERRLDRVGVPVAPGDAVEPPAAVEKWVLNLKVGRRLRAIPLEQVADFGIDDPVLEAELDKALAALAQAKDQDKKPVTIGFRGEGERRVRMGYVVETPVWKTSYRLVLGGTPAAGNPAGAAAGAPAAATKPAAGAAPAPATANLQGWAIVENQTDNDWTDVQLSLVSGRPISFIQDLAQPLYIPRPVVTPQLFASLRPQTYPGGLTNEEAEKRQAGFDMAPDFNLAGGKGGGGGQGGGGGGGASLFGSSGSEKAKRADQNAGPMDVTASIQAAASASKLGELFEYTIPNVTLPRQRSAMIPIVTDPVEMEKVSIYNENVLSDHPLNGVRVKNTTKKHLLQGPVTVLEAGSYAGDARLDDVPPGQSRLLSYGVDLNVVVIPDAAQPEHGVRMLRSAVVVDGVLRMTQTFYDVRTYSAQNKGAEPRTVIIEHTRNSEWRLVEPKQADEETADLFRLRLPVAAGATAKLVVRTEGEQFEQFALFGTAEGTLIERAQDGRLSPKVREVITEVIKRRRAVAEATGQAEQRRKDLADVSIEQQRIRENLKTVAANTEYSNRLLAKLNEQETRIETLQKEMAEFKKSADAQQAELQKFVEKLAAE